MAIIPVLGAGNCKKKTPVAPPPPVQNVQVTLQVASINPSTGDANKSFDAKVFGSGFKSGATVSIGGTGGEQVRVLDGNSLSLSVPGMAPGTYDVTVTNPNSESSTLRGGLTVRKREIACKKATVRFAFDKARLRDGAKSKLDGHMSCYQGLGGSIKIEGHADERGSIDYNLALGERRANSVKRYLAGAGISKSRITTVSYGEERPADPGHNEDAWQKNRRAVILASE